jgi:hypothetical protein
MAITSPWHPDRIEELYTRRFQACVDTCARKIHPALALVFAILTVGIFISFDRLWVEPFIPRAHLDVLRLTRHAAYALVPLSFLALWISENLRTLFEWVILTAVWIGLGIAFRDSSTAGAAEGFFAFFPLISGVTALLFAWRARPSYNRILASIVFVGAFFAVFANLALSAERGSDSLFWFRQAWAVEPQYYFFMGLAFLLSSPTESRLAPLATNPAHLLFPLSWPMETRASLSPEFRDRYRLWWEGFFRVVKAMTLALLLLAAHSNRQLAGAPVALRALWGYFFLLIATVIVGNLGVGLAQMFRLPAPPGTWFVFFARSPLDFWKRDSTYAYRYAIRFIYFPLARLLRKGAPALIGSFFIYICYRFLFRQVLVASLSHRLAPSLPDVDPTAVPAAVTVGLSWLVVMLISVRFWISGEKTRDSARWAWLSILLTHLAVYSTDLALLLFVSR